jgi:hypothetical protein
MLIEVGPRRKSALTECLKQETRHHSVPTTEATRAQYLRRFFNTRDVDLAKAMSHERRINKLGPESTLHRCWSAPDMMVIDIPEYYTKGW